MHCLAYVYGYVCGIRDSLRSLFVLHKLDQISDEERTKLEEKQKELLHPKVTTVLQQRRQAANATKEKRSVELVEKPKARTGLLYSLTLNMVLVLGLYFTMPNENSTFARIIHGCVCVFALIASRVFSSLWFSDIANASLKYAGVQTPNISLSRMTGDFCSAILLDIVFFVQSIFVNSMPVPYISTLLAFIHMALLNSLFSFEYLWMSLGVGLRARINRIERNWPYFLGYGTVLTLLTRLTDSMMVNALLFGALFPFCIISSYLVHADTFERSTFLYVHIFGPSLATTNYMISSLSSILKSFGSRNVRQAKIERAGRTPIRDHHSNSPVRPNTADVRVRHARTGRSVE